MSLPANRPSPRASTRRIWKWLHRAIEQAVADANLEADFDPSVLPAAVVAVPQAPTVARARYALARREQRAIRWGFYLCGRKQPDPWAEVRRCLEAETVTRDFRRLVARMIEGNILHERASVPTGLDRGDTLRRRALYADPVKELYRDLGEQGRMRLAERLVAFDVCLEYHDCAEPYEVANWRAFLQEFARFEKSVKSVCGPHRGTDKAAKGIGAEVLSAAAAARVIPEE